MIDFDSTSARSTSNPPPSNGFCAAILAVLVVLNTFAVLRWAAADTRPVAWDEALHTRNTFEYRERMGPDARQPLFMPVYFNYPPLFNLTLVPFVTRVDDVADAGAAANVFYLAALVVAVFLIGRRLMDAWSGLAAAMAIGFYPIVAMMARVTILDLALTTWVAWGFYALIRSDSFSNIGWSALFGAFLGLGMLTKWTAFIYLAGPALAAMIAAVRLRTGSGILVAAAVGLAVMAPWYSVNTAPMLARVLQLKDQQPAGGLILHGLANALWYPIGFFEQMNIVFLAVFAVGLVFAVKRRPLRPVFLWLGVSILLFTLINNKNTRYSLPALPAAALISMSWIRGRRNAFVLAAALSLAFFAVFNFSRLDPAVSDVAGIRLTYFDNQPPRREDWKHGEIITAVRSARNQAAPFTRVVTVSNAPYLHSTSLNVSMARSGENQFAFRGVSKRRWLDFAEFILLKTGDLGPDFTTETVREHANWMASPPPWFSLIYRETGRWPLPDGGEAILYHAEPQPRPVSENELFSLSLTEIVMPNLTATGVDVNATPISPEETALGRLARVDIRCSSVTFKGLTVSGVRIELDRPQINLPRYRDDNEVQLLSLDRIGIHGTIDASTIIDYAARKAKWLKEPSVVFDDDMIRVSGRAGGIPIEIDVRLELEPDYLTPRLQRIKIAGIRLPTLAFRALTDRSVNLAPNRESPFRIDLGKIRGDGKTLTVGA